MKIKYFIMACFLIFFIGCKNETCEDEKTVNKNITNKLNNDIKIEVKNIDNIYYSQLSEDIINCISPLYKPATTKFLFSKEENINFNNYLIEQLRTRGYAINENDNNIDTTNFIKITTNIYGYSNKIIIKIFINNYEIIRLYEIDENKNINAISLWAKKE